MRKQIDWQKMWKQRDKSLDILEYHRIGKSVIRQASTLIISDLFDKSNKYFRMNKAKVKIRGHVFGFRVYYGTDYYNKIPSIKVTAYCDDEYQAHKPLVRAIAKELRISLTVAFNQIDELKNAFIDGVIK